VKKLWSISHQNYYQVLNSILFSDPSTPPDSSNPPQYQSKLYFKSISINMDIDVNNLLNININHDTFMSFVKSDANRELLINQLKFELQIPHIVQ